jgi:hypothetical protein
MPPDALPDATKTINSILRSLTILKWATAVLLALCIGVAGYTYLKGQVMEGALCALRGDLEKRVATTEDFLSEHPEGIPGIPAESLRISLDGQKRTIETLNSLSC